MTPLPFEPAPPPRRPIITRTRIVNALSSALVTGMVVVTLIIANAPTWGWIGVGWIVWLITKVQDWVKALADGRL